MTGPRLACIDVPALPLQLVLRDNPDWRPDPLVIVEKDDPLSPVLFANPPATAAHIRPGMRFNQAQMLTPRLRGAVVAEAQLAAEHEALLTLLLRYSPGVEPNPSDQGVFWLDASGLAPLYKDLRRWAAALREALEARSLTAAIVVGFERYRTLALAKNGTGVSVMANAEAEALLSARVPLARLGLSPTLTEQLGLLGVTTLGALATLPKDELGLRYGEEAKQMHARQSGGAALPLAPVTQREPVRRAMALEPPDDDRERLLFGLKSMLDELLRELHERCEGATALRLRWELDHAPALTTRLEAAAPTLDGVRLLDLVRLRMQELTFAAPVTCLELELESVQVHPEQLAFLVETPKRDLTALSRAIARLKATLGPSAVTRARLRDAHLPEASFAWEPTSELDLPSSTALPEAPLVRRLCPERPALPPPRLAGPTAHGRIERLHGPYRLAGGWWREATERDYHFVETHDGAILWLYHDRTSGRWFLHGLVD
jgi:protein ImuB